MTLDKLEVRRVCMTLDKLEVGKKAKIVSLLDSNLKDRLIDLGFVPDAIVECQLISPLKDPVAYRVKGALIAIRKEDAKSVIIGEIYE